MSARPLTLGGLLVSRHTVPGPIGLALSFPVGTLLPTSAGNIALTLSCQRLSAHLKIALPEGRPTAQTRFTAPTAGHHSPLPHCSIPAFPPSLSPLATAPTQKNTGYILAALTQNGALTIFLVLGIRA